MEEAMFTESLEAAASEKQEDGSGDKSSAMTWLQAAEHVLTEEGPEMHIRDLTNRIMELGMVNSSCTTSLETLLYRQTSKGNSKFVRVAGKMGCFGLRGMGKDLEKPTIVLPSERPLVPWKDNDDGGVDYEPKVFYKRKRKYSYRSSDSSSSYSSDDSDDEDEDDEEEDESSSELEGEEGEMVYRKRYNFLRKMAKSMIYSFLVSEPDPRKIEKEGLENAAMAKQLSLIEDKITRAEAERRFLLQKLMQFEKWGRQAASTKSHSTSKKHVDASKQQRTLPVPPPPPPPPPSLPPAPPPPPPPALIHISPPSKKSTPVTSEVKLTTPSGGKTILQADTSSSIIARNSGVEGLSSPNLDLLGLNVRATPTSAHVTSTESSLSSSSGDSEEEGATTGGRSPKVAAAGKRARSPREVKGQKTEAAGESAKNKRSSKVRRLHSIPLKEDGTPIFPIQIGGLKVLNLGKIVDDRPGYHSERYIMPVSFQSSRMYPSMSDPSKKCTYTCTILDGGDTPLFEMVAEDDPGNPIRAATSTACQTSVLKAINRARDKQATNSGSGPEFFGYANPTIQNLIQNMPGAMNCSKYKFVKFEGPQKTQKRATQKSKASKKAPALQKVAKSSSKPFHSPTVASPKSQSIKGQRSPNPSPAVAPVLGMGPQQFGMETSFCSSSSDEWSSDSENELIIDG